MTTGGPTVATALGRKARLRVVGVEPGSPDVITIEVLP